VNPLKTSILPKTGHVKRNPGARTARASKVCFGIFTRLEEACGRLGITMRPCFWTTIALACFSISGIDGFLQPSSGGLVPKLRQMNTKSNVQQREYRICRRPPMSLKMQSDKGKGGALDAAVRYIFDP
jgi:hypothetical protein